MKAPDFLTKAKELLTQRGKERDSDDGERSMVRAINAWWTLYGDAILARGHPTEAEGWEFMSILKKSRKAHGVYQVDDYQDDVCYAALG